MRLYQSKRMLTLAIFVMVTMLNACSALLNPPIALNAKFVDQHGEPAPGVKVYYHATIAPLIKAPMVGPGTEDFQTFTDKDGRIDLQHRGMSLWIEKMEHPSYLFMAPGFNVFAERYHLPPNATWPAGEMSEKNPVIIPVWKRENAAPLIVEARALFTVQGKVDRVKLKGTPMELELLWDTPGNDRSPGAWSIRIRVINGEIQATRDSFLFHAPVSGYQSEWIGGGGTDPEKRVRRLEEQFYFVDTQRKFYGRMRASINPYFRNENELSFTYYINPTGGRSLLNDTPSGN